GPQLEQSLELLARKLGGRLPAVERSFKAWLRRSGFDLLQGKALAALTPGAVTRLPAGAAGRDFIEQVEYHGRRLTKLKVPPGRILEALRIYLELLGPLLNRLGEADRIALKEALEQWRFCVIVTLNNAIYQVAEAETLACHALFRDELESAGLDELLQKLLETLVSFSRAEAGALFLREGDGRRWVLRARIPAGQAPAEPLVRQLGAQWVKRLAGPRCELRRSGRPLGLALEPGWRERFQCCWSVPLKTAATLAGVVQFGFSKHYQWLPRELDVLSLAAERCLLAAEKARLMEDLAARQAQVRELAARLVEVEERERRRISGELHDEAGQSLLSIRLRLELIERGLPAGHEALRQELGEIRRLTEKTIVEIRRLLSALSPAVLEQLGLAAAIRQLAGRWRQASGIHITVRADLKRPAPKPVEVAAYRLAQEALHNAVRHSKASRINLSVVSADDALRLTVEDNGTGFCVEQALAKAGSLGLAGMRERVALLGGEFHLRSRPGHGTKISVLLPMSLKEKS
ncbi:MAG TPA: GAF domain-containing sensor histidine kinase, partial [Anaerolineaceae bacterium]|nr:GAF domain-containing sensor histidine kinase [Anaerolineaceae bacterium]